IVVEGRGVSEPDATVRHLELEPRRTVAEDHLAIGHDLTHLEIEPNPELRPRELHGATAYDRISHRIRLPGGEVPSVRKGAKNAPRTCGERLEKFDRLHESRPERRSASKALRFDSTLEEHACRSRCWVGSEKRTRARRKCFRSPRSWGESRAVFGPRASSSPCRCSSEVRGARRGSRTRRARS